MICCSCKFDKPDEEFAARDGGKRRHTRCKECQKEYRQTYWQKNSHKYADRYWTNHEHHKAECRRRYHASDKKIASEKTWRNKLKREFGITVEQYNLMLESQGGVCYLCRNPDPDGKKLAVDHCHTHGNIRGLLCRACNTGIGLLRDSPELLRRAADYIETHTPR